MRNRRTKGAKIFWKSARQQPFDDEIAGPVEIGVSRPDLSLSSSLKMLRQLLRFDRREGFVFEVGEAGVVG
jgi:hypothetical protein